MKKFKFLSVLLILTFVAGVAYSATPSTLKRQSWNAEQSFRHGMKVGTSGEFKFDDSGVSGVNYDIPLQAFYIRLKSGTEESGAQSYAAITSSTIPVLSTLTGVPSVMWADGRTTRIETVFEIPDSYVKGGSFKVLAAQVDAANTAAQNYVRYTTDILYPGRNIAGVTTRTHPPVIVPANANLTSPQVVTLLFVSPNEVSPDNVKAGSLIRLSLWRDDTGDGTGTSTGDMHILKVWFDPAY